jgi:hypothetical protein
MAFKKGQVSNPNGRPKGARSKKTLQQEEAFMTIMTLLEERLRKPETVDALSFRQLAELYSNMLNYVKPKLSSIKTDNTTEVNGGITIRMVYDDDTPAPTNGDN